MDSDQPMAPAGLAGDTSGAWRAFAMGPKLRAYLGFAPDDGADRPLEARGIEGEVAGQFTEFLSAFARNKGLANAEAFSDLLDELVAMDLPEAVLRLASEHPEQLSPDDFRAQLCVGVAAMMRRDLGEAEERFRSAQELLPEEPAPYVNLVQIFRELGRADEAELWCVSGLDADPNNFKLWDLIASIYQTRFGDYTPDRLLQLAEKRASWAGLSLAANMTSTGDRYFKLTLLERLYHQGERDPQFLIELTGAMGVAGEMERIPPLVWQAERLAQKGLPWQLHVHCGQAHLAMAKAEDCLRELAKARQDPQLPDEVRDGIAELEDEARGLATDPASAPPLLH